MLKNVGKDGFEILGQTAQARARRGAQKSFRFVPPVTYPDLAGMAPGWAAQN